MFVFGHPVARLPFRNALAATFRHASAEASLFPFPVLRMDAKQHRRARRLLKLAYAPPTRHGRRRDESPVHAGPLFDVLVIGALVVLGIGYFL